MKKDISKEAIELFMQDLTKEQYEELMTMADILDLQPVEIILG